MKKTVLFFSACILSLSLSLPISAQDYGAAVASGMRMHEHNCLSGNSKSASNVSKTRNSALRNFEGYLQAAGSSASANVAPFFFSRSKKNLERYPTGIGDYNAVNDSLARHFAELGGDPTIEPVAFFKAGDGRNAIGVWIIKAPEAGPILGYYRVRFGKQRGDWKIFHIETFQPSEPAPTITQYCHKPGDVEEYLSFRNESE